MLNFPFYSSVGFIFTVFISLIGLGLGIACFFGWRDMIRELRNPRRISAIFEYSKEEQAEPFKIVFGSIVSCVFVIVGILSLIWSSSAIYHFRNLPIAKVKAARVSRIKEELGPSSGSSIDYNDSTKLQTALSTLTTCYEERREHEHYLDGYRIELILDEPSSRNYLLFVFRHSSADKHKDAVIPNLNDGLNLGDFDCSEFQSWVQENIDPLFPANPGTR